MPGEQHVDSRLAYRLKRELLPTDRLAELRSVADRKREHRVVRDEDFRHVVRLGERRPDELHLLAADPPVLEGQRAGGVYAKDSRPLDLVERAQAFVDEPFVAGQRRKEAAKDIVQRHVVIAGHAKHFMASIAKPRKESACFLELLRSGALRKIPADDDEIWLGLVNSFLDCVHQTRVVGPEMEVG